MKLTWNKLTLLLPDRPFLLGTTTYGKAFFRHWCPSVFFSILKSQTVWSCTSSPQKTFGRRPDSQDNKYRHAFLPGQTHRKFSNYENLQWSKTSNECIANMLFIISLICPFLWLPNICQIVWSGTKLLPQAKISTRQNTYVPWILISVLHEKRTKIGGVSHLPSRLSQFLLRT